MSASSSLQFRSVTQSCPTLCDPMNRSTPGLPVYHQLPESTQPMSIESVMTSSHLILCRPLLLLPSTFPSIRVFSNESALTTASGTQISNEQAPHTGSCMRVEKRSPFEIFGREYRYYQSNWRHRISSPGSELKYGDMEAPHLGQFWPRTHGWPWGLEDKVPCVCLQKLSQSRHGVSIQEACVT